MILPIIQVASSLRLYIVLLAIFIIAGCTTTPPPLLPQITQLQVRQIQSREYSNVSSKSVLIAIIAALQDEGFIISSTNENLGLVTARKEITEVDKNTKQSAEFWYGPGIGTYQTSKRFEASASVAKHNNIIRIRINMVAKAVTNAGGIIWSQPIYDQMTYQNIFSKIDKSIFLSKHNL